MDAKIEVSKAGLKEIEDMRESYRQQMSCQIVHDSYHERGFTDLYLVRAEGKVVGYGAVAAEGSGAREVVKEFWVFPEYERLAFRIFQRFVAASSARWVEAQTNDRLLSLILFDTTSGVAADRVLFADAATTQIAIPAAKFRRVSSKDKGRMFRHEVEPEGEWCLDIEGEIVATGGLMFHYNPPYGDLYMEVASPHRRRGYGSFLVQELKRLCYDMSCIPAARCNIGNLPSRKTLERAGMYRCGHIIRGAITTAGG